MTGFVRAWALGMAALVAAACGDSTAPPPPGGGDVSLAVGQFALYTGTEIAGALRFPAAASGGAQYLIVAQSATGTSGLTTAFSLSGAAGAAARSTSAELAPPPSGGEPSLALRFHDGLRRIESQLAAEARAAGIRLAAPAVRPAPATITPPVVGSSRSFKVCGDLDCSLPLQTVVATARYVGTHAAIFVDDSAPAGGLTGSDLQQMGQQFDAVLYPIDRQSFGAESDIDSNGVVIILLTPKVNALVGSPQCDDSYVTGYFFGADLMPGYSTRYNNGEVFYGFVPDPGPVCPYSVSLVRHLIPVTFIHEFQHMISFNQHVLVRNGETEVLWLNEALSHLAEELGGRHYDSLRIDTTASRFYIGNLYNAFKYLKDPLASAVVTTTGPGELTERGAEWLFVRYLVDRFGAQTSHDLVNTSSQGATNVAAATGTAFATLLGHWALAVYASDYPGFTAPAELRYASWRFRTTFADLNAQRPTYFDRVFPLVPFSGTGGAVSVTGTLRSGSGAFVLATQAPDGRSFELDFSPSAGSTFPSATGAQIAVVRLR
jgi:hypothetical protein